MQFSRSAIHELLACLWLLCHTHSVYHEYVIVKYKCYRLGENQLTGYCLGTVVTWSEIGYSPQSRTLKRLLKSGLMCTTVHAEVLLKEQLESWKTGVWHHICSFMKNKLNILSAVFDHVSYLLHQILKKIFLTLFFHYIYSAYAKKCKLLYWYCIHGHKLTDSS